MFSIFSKTKILGLDITEEYIRYSLILKKGDSNTLLSFGEEKIARVEPRNALLSALRNIVRKTGQKNVNVSFPPSFVRTETISVPANTNKGVAFEIEIRLKEKLLLSHHESILYYEKFESINSKDFYNVFISSKENIDFIKSVFTNLDLNVKKIVSHKDALISSCVRVGEIIDTMIIDGENLRTDIAIYSPFNRFKLISKFSGKDEVGDLIKETYKDFYDISGDKIGYFFVTGSFANDNVFINNISKDTRMPIQEADVLVNLNFKKDEVPPLTREESLLFAVALGVAMS